MTRLYFLQKNLKVLLCIFFLEEPGPCPRLHYCFLTSPPLLLPSFCSLISNYLNLHTGTQESLIAWTKPLPQKHGCKKDLYQKVHHRVLFGFNTCLQLIGWQKITKPKVKATQWCPILCDPMDYAAPGFSRPEYWEWVTVPFSRGSSEPRHQTQVSWIAGRFFPFESSWGKKKNVSSLGLLNFTWSKTTW